MQGEQCEEAYQGMMGLHLSTMPRGRCSCCCLISPGTVACFPSCPCVHDGQQVFVPGQVRQQMLRMQKTQSTFAEPAQLKTVGRCDLPLSCLQSSRPPAVMQKALWLAYWNIPCRITTFVLHLCRNMSRSCVTIRPTPLLIDTAGSIA